MVRKIEAVLGQMRLPQQPRCTASLRSPPTSLQCLQLSIPSVRLRHRCRTPALQLRRIPADWWWCQSQPWFSPFDDRQWSTHAGHDQSESWRQWPWFLSAMAHSQADDRLHLAPFAPMACHTDPPISVLFRRWAHQGCWLHAQACPLQPWWRRFVLFASRKILPSGHRMAPTERLLRCLPRGWVQFLARHSRIRSILLIQHCSNRRCAQCHLRLVGRFPLLPIPLLTLRLLAAHARSRRLRLDWFLPWFRLVFGFFDRIKFPVRNRDR